MAMSSYITLLDNSKIASSPNTYLTIKYAHERSGANMLYKIYVYASIPSTSWRYDSGGLQIKLDGAEVYYNSTWKPNKSSSQSASGSGWPATHEQTYVVAPKTSGTTSLSVHFWDSKGAADYNVTKTYDLIVDAAGSAMGTTSSGYTIWDNGTPTVNVTKYSSNFYDVITLTYNGRTITRNDFTSSKLSFSEAERLTIFQAQGAGTSKEWTISGTTYTDSSKTTSVGTFSGTVTIKTEDLHEISSLPSVNVESSMNVSTLVHCGGTYDIVAYLTSNRTAGNNDAYVACGIWDRSTAMSAVSMTPDKDKIYPYNTSSKSGTLYWRITSKINGTAVGYRDYTSTYNFVQSLCGPSISTFTYKVTDQGTKTLKGASGNAISYNTSPGELGLFIKGKTTLQLAVSGSVNTSKNATLSKYNITVPGQTITGSSATTYNTQVLNSNGEASASLTDSRGFTTSSLKFSYTLNDYFSTSINSVSGERYPKSATEENNDKKVRISFSATAPNYILSNNNFVVKYRYKISGGSWTTVTTDLTKSSCTISGNTISVSNFTLTPSSGNQKFFDTSSQYEIQIGITDYYNSTGIWSSSIVIPVSSPLLAKRLRRLGINKIPASGYALDVSGKVRTDSSVEASTYINAGTVVSAGTSVKIPKSGSNGYGLCNSDGTSIIRDHNNTNVTVDATGGTLFLGYQNTVGLNILNSKGTMDSNGNYSTSANIKGWLNTTVKALPSGTDGRDYWNSLKNGLYWYSNSGSPANMPGSYGWVEKIGYETSGDFSVRFYSQNLGKIFRKSGNSASVSDWINDALYAYPVGSVYMSLNSTNPHDLFGGNWTRLQGYYLYAGTGTYSGSSATSVTSYTGAGTQGHQLTIAEMPSHTHTYGAWKPKRASDGSKWPTADSDGDYTTSATGGNQAHSHDVATLQVYVWFRYS